jgi:hypothetical protein
MILDTPTAWPYPRTRAGSLTRPADHLRCASGASTSAGVRRQRHDLTTGPGYGPAAMDGVLPGSPPAGSGRPMGSVGDVAGGEGRDATMALLGRLKRQVTGDGAAAGNARLLLQGGGGAGSVARVDTPGVCENRIRPPRGLPAPVARRLFWESRSAYSLLSRRVWATSGAQASSPGGSTAFCALAVLPTRSIGRSCCSVSSAIAHPAPAISRRSVRLPLAESGAGTSGAEPGERFIPRAGGWRILGMRRARRAYP